MFNNLTDIFKDKLDKLRALMRSLALPLEVVCYVCGSGAFCVFIRWLQLQLAFDDKGLNSSSVWNLFTVLIALASLYMAYRFMRRFRKGGYVISRSFTVALRNPGSVYAVFRWFFGLLMCFGALLLLMACETDRDAGFLRILSLFGFLCGITYPVFLGRANREENKPFLLCLLAVVPVAMFAIWLITSYKINDINSILWAFVVEMVALCASMTSFFYMAGFVYDTADPCRSFFTASVGAFMCFMALADERYAGQQLMFLSAALMQVLYVWILVANMKRPDTSSSVTPSAKRSGAPSGTGDGFIEL